MASPTITSHAAFGSMMPTFWDRLLGDNLNPNLYAYDLGEKRKLPANFGKSIKIPRIKKSTITWAEPTEGVATATCALSTEFVSGTLTKFKGAVKHSDLVIMTGLSDIIQLSLERIGYELAKTMDTHIQNQISANGTLLAPNGSTTSLGVGTLYLTGLKPKDIIRAEIDLSKRDVPRFPGVQKYAALIHPRTKYDVFTATSSSFANWVDVNKYNNAEKIFNGDVGSMFGFKFIVSSNTKTGMATLSVANSSFGRSLFMGPRAFYVVELNEMNARTYVKQLGSSGSADPTNDVCTVGAKVFFTAIPAAYKGVGSGASASADNRMCRIYHTLTV